MVRRDPAEVSRGLSVVRSFLIFGGPEVEVHYDAENDECGIWPLLLRCPKIFADISPERGDELTPLFDKLTVRLVEDDSCVAEASAQNHTIVIGRAFFESLWCASYAYMYFRRQMEKLGARRAFESTPELMAAIDLLVEGVEATTTRRRVRFAGRPSPCPTNTPSLPEHQEFADDMACIALCFIFHHELAHIRLGHTTTADCSWTLDQEKDADALAIDWFLGRIDEAPSDHPASPAKRIFGILIATSLLIARSLSVARSTSTTADVELSTHPMPYDRLARAVDHSSVRENKLLLDTAVSFACATLVPHIRIHGIDLSPGPYADFHALYQCCLDALSGHLVR